MSIVSPEMLLADAFSHHRSGRLADAERLYRAILEYKPDHAVAMHHLGVVAQQFGRTDDAIELMSRSVELDPTDAR